jgi:hypothetical protein
MASRVEFHDALAEKMIAEARGWTSLEATDFDRLTALARRAVSPEMLATFLAVRAADALDASGLPSSGVDYYL